MKKKKQPAEPESDNVLIMRLGTEVDRSAQRWRTARTLLWVLLIGFCVHSLAGKTTVLNSAIDWSFKANIGKYVLGLIVLITGGGWWWERGLRLREVSSLTTRIKELETGVDPNRGSSGLTLEGRPTKMLRERYK
jgi:hypothetical protein